MKELPAVVTFKDSDKSFEFYTPAMEEAFTRHGEQIRDDDILRLRIRLSAQKYDISIGYGFQKRTESEWSEVQRKILGKVKPSRLGSERFATITNFTILNGDRRELDFEEVREDVERQLEVFIKNLKQFEEAIIF